MIKPYKHGQVVRCKHNIIEGDMNHPKDEDETNIPCDGIVTWDEAMEGLICDKCELYTGVK
jgi:hypothetical protein